MKKFLKAIYVWIRGAYYNMLLICGILGIAQKPTEYKDTNILILTVSIYVIGYSVKNLIKIAKEICDETV